MIIVIILDEDTLLQEEQKLKIKLKRAEIFVFT